MWRLCGGIIACLLALFHLTAFTALVIFLLEAIGHLLGNVAVFFKVDMRVGLIEDHGAL